MIDAPGAPSEAASEAGRGSPVLTPQMLSQQLNVKCCASFWGLGGIRHGLCACGGGRKVNKAMQ